jgi:acetyl/propionyl-CoA carboxylase alpha subunit/acetyl-CoA carboxylase carboxyltransferase component
MTVSRVLIANRGEIAISIARACADLGIGSVAVFSEDDARCLHILRADEARPLRGAGPSAYLDLAQIIEIAGASRCDAVHPGYGFLSENAAFARACAAAGLIFIGPSPETLELVGDKARARAFARSAGVPVLAGSDAAVSLDEARAFFASLGRNAAMIIKAVAGGGGRGMRIVRAASEIDEAYERCRSEARAAFGDADVYVEERLPRARHIEVQVLGDAAGHVTHLWERDCTIQRRHQKLIEIAPSPWLAPATRQAILDAAVRLANDSDLRNLCTFEFLVDASATGDPAFYFIEANPRLQVEHTVTEEVTGVDLVQTQLQLAAGGSLADLGLDDPQRHAPRGFALQARVYAESVDATGAVRPSAGTLSVFEPPSGRGVRVDTHGYAGYRPGTAFDALLAKVIVNEPTGDVAPLAARAQRALREFHIEGVATNAALLRRLLAHAAFAAGDAHTTFFEEHIAELAAETGDDASQPFFTATKTAAERAGVRVDPNDPLAVLAHGKSAGAARATAAETIDLPEGVVAVRAPLQGTVISVDVTSGDFVRKGERLLVMEAMKMEHVIAAPSGGQVRAVNVAAGDAIFEGAVLLLLEPAEVDAEDAGVEQEVDLEVIRPDLAEVIDRHAAGLDAQRPAAVERRRKTRQRTARENIEDLCDPGSFIEYGPLVIAAQRRRRTVEELIEQTPADGLVAGIGTVNGDIFGEDRARCVAMSYDYTVLAGTQGQQNHRKKDRMFELAEKWRLPIVFFTEGGGGRPGDTDGLGVAGLDCMAFHYFGRLSGLVPLVGIVSGRCFAGNAALLGCCDVIIATKDANIGMGGPAMIEGGGLGVFRPEEVGPTAVQSANGVIDVLVEDEAQAVAVAKRYLSYLQGPLDRWSCADQRRLRAAIPENRRRVYDIRAVVDTLADEGSVLELRRQFGHGMVTALIRIEGRPLGLIANNPMHLAGAIDSDAADKAARFMQLCDAFDVPLLSLCDTPGIMVGPEVEKTALVRHASRMFVTGASISVPIFTIILRKGYGLGAQAMAGGSFKAPFFTVAWPTGEFGGMGLEGAVKLGYRNELAAMTDPAQRKAAYDEMVERMYRHGKAVNTASHFEIDDVIDPMESRAWITRALRSLPPAPPRNEKKRPSIDTW